MILDIDPVAEKDKRDAALSSVTGAVFLTGLKLTVGILAEAIHAQVAGLSQVLIHVEPGG